MAIPCPDIGTWTFCSLPLECVNFYIQPKHTMADKHAPACTQFLRTCFCFTGTVLPSSSSSDVSSFFLTKIQHWTKGEALDVRAVMDTWTLQKGFPLVLVMLRGKNVHLQQERYMVGADSPSSTG